MPPGLQAPDRRGLVSRRRVALAAILVLSAGLFPAAAGGGLSSIRPDELREWLTDIVVGRAAGPGDLRRRASAWPPPTSSSTCASGTSSRPATPAATFRPSASWASRRRAARRVTVQVGRQTRTFKDGEGVTFRDSRARSRTRRRLARRVRRLRARCAGGGPHGLSRQGREGRGGRLARGATGRRRVDAGTYRRILTGRSRYAVDQLGAIASIDAAHAVRRRAAVAPARGTRRPAAAARATCRSTSRRRSGSISRLPRTSRPRDAFLTFLFSRAPVGYDELKRKAAAQEPLPSFRLNDVKHHVQRRRRLRGRPHAAHAQRRRHRRRQRSAAEGTPTSPSAPTTITSATRIDRRRPATSGRRARPAASPPAPAAIASGTAPTTTDRARWR